MGVAISVPETLTEWVEARASSAGYESPEAYLAELILRDRQDEDERGEIVAALMAGETSGQSERSVSDILSALKEELGIPAR